MVFEGTSHFMFRDGLIARYEENFDRGMALAQQDFAAERIKKVLLKLADRQNASAGCQGAFAAVRVSACAPLPLVARPRRFRPDLHLCRRAAVAQW